MPTFVDFFLASIYSPIGARVSAHLKEEEHCGSSVGRKDD